LEESKHRGILLLRNKTAIISGATKGIGFSMAKVFSEDHGAFTIVCSRDINRAKLAANQINGRCMAEQVDVSDEISVRNLVKRVMAKHGRIDILINNAGFYFDKGIWYKSFHEITTGELARILAVDLWGSVYLSREVIRAYLKSLVTDEKKKTTSNLKSDCKNNVVIINISSTPAIEGHFEGSPYTIAKSAIIGLTKCIAKEYAKDNIRSYTLALGNIATLATFGAMDENEREKAAIESPMKRWGRPEEIARIAACIASDNFSYATGNTIIVDGGTIII
jgi:NAD(P)-dependent dehydrogenase (short-subunit alcohol dehydrogenase family)